MTRRIEAREVSALVQLSGGERYEYFVKKAADCQEVWSLGGDDGWVMAEADGQEAVPVWPHPAYAEMCATGSWQGHEPRPIPLSDWLEKWTPGLTRDGRGVAVFPLPEDRGVRVSPEYLENDLREELAKYE